MKSKAIFMALLAFVFGAQAVPVSVNQVRTAANAWANRGQVFGARIGVAVDAVAEHRTTTGAKFYAVKMSGGGTLFMSADDQISPVIAFTSSDADFSTIDPASPLWALLNADVSGRSVVMSAASGSVQAKAQWRELLAAKASVSASGEVLDGASRKSEIGDLRVDKLVKSQWDQTMAGGKKCYNLHTPKNYCCGCVATAMSQLLRYVYGPTGDGGLGYPAPAMTEASFPCTVDEAATTCTIDGEPYAWGKMKLVPADGVSDEECEAIGKLTADAGATVNMNYGSDGSGAMSVKTGGALVKVFGFRQACYVGVVYTTDDFDLTEEKLQRTMFANFDAGYPVLLSINGQRGGHAIVADGYGYDGGEPYVHLNMGWSGSQDMWYNLPHMEGAGFNVVNGVTYNAFPTEGGLSGTMQVQAAVLAGRVVDDDGAGLAGAKITIVDSSTQQAVKNLVSGDKGIWSAILPAGRYDVGAVSADGLALADLENVELKTPNSGKSDYGPYVSGNSDVGNSWGNALVLAPPAVRIGSSTYSSLDKALAAAQDGDVVEILLPTELKRSCDVGVSCTIRAADGFPATDVAVLFPAGVTLSVASGARVLFQDVAFTNAAQNVVITVAAGGTAAVSGHVGVQEFDTADADGFELAGRITTGFVLDCAGKKSATDVIGRVTASEGLDCAANIRIRNEYDPDGELGGKASDDGNLIWDSVPVPDDSAVVRLVFGDGTHRNFMTFRTLAGYLTPDVTKIEICKNCDFSETITVTNDLKVASAEGMTCTVTMPCPKGEWASPANFTVTGGTLTLTNVVFSGCEGEGLFVVDGETAKIVLDDGAVLEDLTGTWYDSGAITVRKGSATLLPGCEIRRCNACEYGGAVLLADWYGDGDAPHLDLQGGRITCCSATYGGGVYVGDGATVSIQGDVVVKDNVSSDHTVADDICLYDSTTSLLTLTGALTSENGSVGVYDFCNEDLNDIGQAFAVVSTDADVAAASAPKFFCDVPYDESVASLVGALSEDGMSLVWQDGGRGVDPVDAKVIVISPDATVTNYFEQVGEAFASVASDGAVVELLTDGLTFGQDLVVEKSVTVRSAAGGPFTLTREGQAKFDVRKGGALTVVALTVDGGGDACEGVLFGVKGATLVLESGAIVEKAVVKEGPNGAGVVVSGGTLVMKDGASVRDCSNTYDDGIYFSEGAGIWADGSTIHLEGGCVTECSATVGGGAVFRECQVSVSGGAEIRDNACGPAADGGFAPNAFVCADAADISLSGDFTGSIGIVCRTTEEEKIDGVFGFVESGYFAEADKKALVDGAALFSNDDANPVVTGCVVTNGATALLVWESALDEDEKGKRFYEDDEGVRYGLLDGETPAPEPVVPDPIAFQSITRLDETTWQLVVTNRVPFCNYRLLYTDDLTKGFVTTGDWEQASADADPVWTTNVVTSGGQLFWKAEAKEGQKE